MLFTREFMMEKGEAQYHFHEADRLYKEENYLEALQHLAELNVAFPETFNVLFPMLLCREKLGRTDEAHEHCIHMLEHFPSEKHQKRLRPLFTHLCRVKARSEAAGNTPPSSSAPPGLVQDTPVVIPIDKKDVFHIGLIEIPWRTIAIYAGIVVLILAVLGTMPVLLNQINDDSEQQSQDMESLLFFLMILTQFAVTCIIAYSVLWTMNKLVHEDILPDLLDVAVFMFIFTLLCLIPLIGWFIGIYKLMEHYEMGIGEVFIFLLLQIIFNMVFLYLVIPLVFRQSALEIIQFL